MLSRLKRFLGLRDELVGEWTSEDGSGISMMAGEKVNFRKDFSGTTMFWGSWSDDDTEEEKKHCYTSVFQWKRIDKNTIAVKDGQESEWKEISYRITTEKYYSSQRRQLEQRNETKILWSWPLFSND